MSNAVTVTVHGLSETKDALRSLFPDRTARAIMTRILIKHAKPMAEEMRRRAPVRTGKLKASITAGKQLSPRQKRLHRPASHDDVEMFVGAGPRKYAHLPEFGTANFPASPFVRPAFDDGASAMLDNLRNDLWYEIEKTAQRAARKALRAASK